MKPGQVTAAVGIGYLLGRTKKMRLAMMIAAAGAISRLGSNPPQLLRRGYQELADIPEVGELADNVRGGLAGAAKSAAVAVATTTVRSLNAKLRGDDTGSEDDDDTDEQSAEEREEEREPARRPSRARAATRSRAPTRTVRRARR